MKSVLISIQPYWVFLIIAKTMGWEIDKEKIIEVRKNFPKADDWNKLVEIYCSKDKKSFNRIPKAYQSLMQKFLGKVIGEFICDRITDMSVVVRNCNEDYNQVYHNDECKGSCLTWKELQDYGKGKPLYGWHISDLKIYDKPKPIMQFYKPCPIEWKNCPVCELYSKYTGCCMNNITRPPQSYMFVEEI